MRAVEGRRPGAARTSTTSCGSGSAAPRTPSSAPATRPTPSSDAEFAANAEVKEELLVEAEALLPVTDLEAAKKAFRDLADRWDAAGKVPRDRMKDLEGRIRKVEQAIRGVEDEQWKRSDPEKSARADDMVAKLEAAIADDRGRAGEGQGRRRRQEGQGARGEPRLPPVLPRDGQAGQRGLQQL